MRRTGRHNPGFTLIEMIVVVSILAIIMAMALPRLVGTKGRELQNVVDRVGDLLVMFAQREALSGTPVGIWHDTQRNWLVLVTLDEADGTGSASARWVPDHAVRPVELPRHVPSHGVTATADGEPVDITLWPIATEPGRVRPAIEITLQADDGTTRSMVLPSYAIAPHALVGGSELAAMRVPVDLDSAGRRREDW